MKKSHWIGLLACTATLLLSGCSSQVLDFRNAEIVNGNIYKAGANEPFTGKVTNIPDSKVLIAQEGFSKISNVLVKIVFAKEQQAFANLGVRPAAAFLNDSPCDVQVTDGRLDGDLVCNQPNTETHVFEGKFKEGALEGDFKYYGPKGGEHVVSQVSFQNGQPDGKQEVFSTNNQKLVYSVHWKKGELEGDEDAYDENTGALVGHATYVAGKADGEIIRYAPDGKQVIYKAIATAGLKNGPEDVYSATTGKHLGHGQWVNGKQQGLFQQWDEQGNLVAQTSWENGNVVEPAAPAAQTAATSLNIDACVEAWTTAFHKENGEEAAVTADQLGEWQGWCKEGKQPG